MMANTADTTPTPQPSSLTLPPPELSVMDVARWWNVDRATITRLCASGKLPARRVGGVWRISQADAENYGRS